MEQLGGLGGIALGLFLVVSVTSSPKADVVNGALICLKNNMFHIILLYFIFTLFIVIIWVVKWSSLHLSIKQLVCSIVFITVTVYLPVSTTIACRWCTLFPDSFWTLFPCLPWFSTRFTLESLDGKKHCWRHFSLYCFFFVGTGT